MKPVNTKLIPEINNSLDLQLADTLTYEELKAKLSSEINHLINNDFEKLVFYLYRIDVNEAKMKYLLDQKQGEDAAGLIAELIIERQLQKIKSRQQFSQRDDDIDSDEKW